MKIAVFDFDGTIIARDSLPDFLIHTFGRRSFLLRLPLICILKAISVLRIISTHRAKEIVFSLFLKGMPYSAFKKACDAYALRIPLFVYPKALHEIKLLQEQGFQLMIISASVPEWISPWANSVGIKLVEGTELEVQNGLLTGRFATPNCKGKEKVVRLQKHFPAYHSGTLFVYGDSSGDKEILSVATNPHYNYFKN